MKASRNDLKAIVKECLLELLSEGLGSAPQINERMSRPVSQPLFSETSRRQPQTLQSKRSASPTPQLRDAVRMEAGGNKVMEAILADTAASTLPKMLQNEGKSPVASPGGLVEQVVASAEPEEIFGSDVTSKWADLAFMRSPIKK